MKEKKPEMTPEEKIAIRTSEAKAYCDMAVAEEELDQRSLFMHSAIMKLFSALDAVPELAKEEGWVWDQKSWEEKQEKLRNYLQRKKEARGARCQT